MSETEKAEYKAVKDLMSDGKRRCLSEVADKLQISPVIVLRIFDSLIAENYFKLEDYGSYSVKKQKSGEE